MDDKMPTKKIKPKAIIHASELLTGAGIRAKDGRRILEEDTGRIEDGAIVYSDKIEWVGKTRDLPRKYARAPKRDLKGQRAVIPGLVDCHTHLVFAGDRSEEFAARCGGASYEEIAARGGGIVSTVKATRAAGAAELETLAVARLREAMAFGVTAIEIKSGYGLSFESEIKILEVIKRLKKRFSRMTIKATFMGAHAFPAEQSRESYLRDIMTRMLPEIAQRELADACDVFVDRGYYTIEEGRAVLSRARELGFGIKMHADELADTGSAAVAAGLGALSADHLLKVNDDGIRALAASDTVAVLLPGTAFYLKASHAPARKLIDAGAAVALSTDFNPGTCMTLSLPSVMTIAALYLGMTRSELLAAVTYNAAKALGLHARKGTLEAGLDADFAVLPFRKFEEMYYRFAWSAVRGPSALS
ncbi:MAG: imidazolonepropionase [Bdellovibrionales bacterium RIFOXYD1_FULL_53_11]|nr:MAG: imidazolonepropionase [Bdellovibrionales bacterium RIFOXYD1_FULL_53_11]